MRIRSIRPEFWSSEDIAAMDWRMVYDGPFPSRPRDYYALTDGSWNVAFVYLLFDRADRLLYVGRARQPGARFDKHRRRKSWWPEVRSLVIIRVAGRDYEDACRVVDHMERRAIRALGPAYNIVGVPV